MVAGRQRTGDGRGPESGMARNAPELVATAWAEVMDATVIAEKGRSVILPEVALVTPRCILVPIGRLAMGAAQQLVKVGVGRLWNPMRSIPVPAPVVADVILHPRAHSPHAQEEVRLLLQQTFARCP